MMDVSNVAPLSWKKRIWLLVVAAVLGPPIGAILTMGIPSLLNGPISAQGAGLLFYAIFILSIVFLFPAGIFGGLMVLFVRWLRQNKGGLNIGWVSLCGFIGGGTGGLFFDISGRDFTMSAWLAGAGMVAAAILWWLRRFLGLGEL